MATNTFRDISNAVFFKSTFLIDDYLSKCTQKSDLHTLKGELKDYGQQVYLDMINILKSETDNIINLAENLTNLNVNIDELAIPVAQLKEEIRSLYMAIKNSELNFKQQLDIINALNEKRDLFNIRTGILLSLTYIKKIIESWNNDQDITILERAVNEYSFQYLYSCELGIEKIVKENLIVNIATELIKLVHQVFLNAIRTNNRDIILRCLTMYANLNEHSEAEKFVRVSIVQPALSKIFSQSNFDHHHNDMQALYRDSLTFLNTEFYILQTIVHGNPDLRGFNFVLNSFWIEADKQLCENLPNIIGPGNPDTFQKRYLFTQEFIAQIISATKIPNLLQIDPSFEAHMKRFNLPVYFEIRFQQIAGKFEAELSFDPLTFDETSLLKNSDFLLSISDTLWNCVKRCMHKDVYIVQLSDQLFKLMMLLFSRYVTWYESSMKWPSTAEDAICRRLEKFAVYTLTDIFLMQQRIGFGGKNFPNSDPVFEIVPIPLRSSLHDTFETTNSLIVNLAKKLEHDIIIFKIQQCVSFLQQVSSIPRIYRRTNRAIPTEHSAYITEAASVLTYFYDAYHVKEGNQTVEILDRVIIEVTESYLKLVQEVIKSVCKTEESLKRLKNRNPNIGDESLGQMKNESMSDEAKIREQIKLDVSYFAQKVKRFSTSCSLNSLQKLLSMAGVN